MWRRPSANVPVCLVDTISLVVTSACNLRCAYCYQNAKSTGVMAPRVLRSAVDVLMASPAPRVTLAFYGGEPLLETGFIREALAYATNSRPPWKSLRFVITTNGTLLKDAVLRLLDDWNVETWLSFDGVPEAQRYRSPDSASSLDGLLGRARRLLPNYFVRSLHVGITAFSGNLRHLADSVRYLIANGVREIAISPLTTHDSGWTPNDEDELARQFDLIVTRSLKHYDDSGWIPVALLRSESEVAPDRAFCGAHTGSSLVVSPDGTAHACTMFASAYQRFENALLAQAADAMCLGSISSRNFADHHAGLRGRPFLGTLFSSRLRKYTRSRRCSACTYVSECMVCPAAITHIPGNRDPDLIPEWNCAFSRAALSARARFQRMVSVTNGPPLPESVPASIRKIRAAARALALPTSLRAQGGG